MFDSNYLFSRINNNTRKGVIKASGKINNNPSFKSVLTRQTKNAPIIAPMAAINQNHHFFSEFLLFLKQQLHQKPKIIVANKNQKTEKLRETKPGSQKSRNKKTKKEVREVKKAVREMVSEKDISS